MAGSLSHVTTDDGGFQMDLIENLGDAHEALEECHQIIAALLVLAVDPAALLRDVCRELNYPMPDTVPRKLREDEGWEATGGWR